jgi:cbb3-type cytochrome oxidase subunit 3
MIKHILGIVAAIGFAFLCTLLPFLPGSYDGLAVALSEMAHLFGILGLMLVPIGLWWIAADRSKRSNQKRHLRPLLALIASTLVWAGLWFAAVVQSGLVLGFVIVALWVYVFRKVWSKYRQTSPARASAIPFYLVTVPVVVALLQWAFVERAIQSSRNRAIQNSAPLLAAIENYRARNGKYPTSLLAELPDYGPHVIGIREYRYEPHGEGYNLVFEQFNYRFGTREFVVYNPRDEHVMTAHASDILELTPEQLVVERTRGHHARHDLPQPHWKIFWFD